MDDVHSGVPLSPSKGRKVADGRRSRKHSGSGLITKFVNRCAWHYQQRAVQQQAAKTDSRLSTRSDVSEGEEECVCIGGVADVIVLREHFGSATSTASSRSARSSDDAASSAGSEDGSMTSSSSRSARSFRTPPSPSRAVNIRSASADNDQGRCTPAEQSQCRALQQKLIHGSLAEGGVTFVAARTVLQSQGCMKRPSASPRARRDSPPPLALSALSAPHSGGAAAACQPCVQPAEQSERRRCRNCNAFFFGACVAGADAAATAGAGAGGVAALGVTSFCSNDCMWSFSLRADDE